MLVGETLYLVVIDQAGLRIDAVLHCVEVFSGEVYFRAMCQMATVSQAHTEDRIARLQQCIKGGRIRLRTGKCIKGGRIRLRTGMRLYVRVVRTEQFFRALDGKTFGNVNILAAAVVTHSRIAFGVFIGQYRALRFQHSWTRVVLRGVSGFGALV
jgi:hypothetical protein